MNFHLMLFAASKGDRFTYLDTFFFVKLNELLSPGRKLIFKALKTLSCPYPSSLSNALYLLKLIIASF